ncbi:hypothetical protein B0H21DRAFT_825349 [Amylocystis lapponica]|nr:hypothetical protein B0H21DRAFT_825349 [Amylocystis lapponica]
MPAYRTRDTTTRTLEVATDAPLPPTVSIISPTPRAFTFPFEHAPYGSPSSSPFEPDLKYPAATPPPIRALSPTSSIGSDSSSVLSTPSAPPSQASHKRRRSTASDIGERRPKKGDEDYIKRPENAFILFRRKCCEDRQAQDEADDVAGPVKKQRQADLSKTISQQWKSLTQEERVHWEELAKEKKKEHEAMYPNYVYRPQRVKDKAKAKKGKGRRATASRRQTRKVASRSCFRSHPPPQSQPRLPTQRPRPWPRPPRRLCTNTSSSLPDDSAPNGSHAIMSWITVALTSYQPALAFPPHTSSSRNNGTLLHSLNIPRESAYASSNMVSPVDSVGSSAIVSPSDSYSSPLSSSSQHSGPFTPAEALSMMSLSLGHQTGEYVEGVPESVSMELSANEMAFAACGWPSETIWPQGNAEMIPDDFDLSAIPPIEFGMAPLDGDVQHQLAESDMTSGFPQECDFDSGEFAPDAEGNDFHDTTPGHDPFPGLFGYESMNW